MTLVMNPLMIVLAIVCCLMKRTTGKLQLPKGYSKHETPPMLGQASHLNFSLVCLNHSPFPILGKNFLLSPGHLLQTVNCCSRQCTHVVKALVHIVKHDVNHVSDIPTTLLIRFWGVEDLDGKYGNSGVVLNALHVQLHLVLRPGRVLSVQLIQQVSIKE